MLSTLITQAKGAVEQMVRRDILMPLCRYNFGDDAARLAPKPSLGDVEQQDVVGMWSAAASLMNADYFTESQMPKVDTMLNLPVREPDDAPYIPARETITAQGSGDPNDPTMAAPTPAAKDAPVTKDTPDGNKSADRSNAA